MSSRGVLSFIIINITVYNNYEHDRTSSLQPGYVSVESVNGTVITGYNQSVTGCGSQRRHVAVTQRKLI